MSGKETTDAGFSPGTWARYCARFRIFRQAWRVGSVALEKRRRRAPGAEHSMPRHVQGALIESIDSLGEVQGVLALVHVRSGSARIHRPPCAPRVGLAASKSSTRRS